VSDFLALPVRVICLAAVAAAATIAAGAAAAAAKKGRAGLFCLLFTMQVEV